MMFLEENLEKSKKKILVFLQPNLLYFLVDFTDEGGAPCGRILLCTLLSFTPFVEKYLFLRRFDCCTQSRVVVRGVLRRATIFSCFIFRSFDFLFILVRNQTNSFRVSVASLRVDFSAIF